MKHTTTIVDNITNYKGVLMIVVFFLCETYNSDLINVPAQIVSYMRKIYYLKNTLIVKQLKAQ